MLIHVLEKSLHFFQTAQVLAQNLGFKFSKQIINIESVKFLNRGRVRWISGCFNDKDVLRFVDFGVNVSSERSIFLLSHNLALRNFGMLVASDLKFSSEIVCDWNQVRSQILVCCAVTDQDRLACSDGLSLSLKTVSNVERVDDPGAVVVVYGTHAGFLVLRLSRVNAQTKRRADGLGAHKELLFEQVRVALNLDFLTEADDVVGSKNVHGFSFFENKNRSHDGAWELGGCRESVGLFQSRRLCRKVHHQVPTRALVPEHHAAPRSQQTVR